MKRRFRATLVAQTRRCHCKANRIRLTETNREAIKRARLIANPGCFATATLLGLAPLVASGLVSGRVIVDAKTGSSGSGAKAAANTHHPQRMNSFYAYKPFTHQHLPEIDRNLKRRHWNRSGSDAFASRPEESLLVS